MWCDLRYAAASHVAFDAPPLLLAMLVLLLLMWSLLLGLILLQLPLQMLLLWYSILAANGVGEDQCL